MRKKLHKIQQNGQKSNENEHKYDNGHSFNLSVSGEIGRKNINRLMIGNLKINSLFSKFGKLKLFI